MPAAFFFLLGLIAIQAEDLSYLPTPVCDDGYHRFESSCYKFFSGKPLTWKEAEAACVKDGAHLPTVLGIFEAQQMLSLSSVKSQKLEDQPWIGYFYDKKKGPHFSDGSMFFKGLSFAEGKMEDADVCGKLIVTNITDAKGNPRQVIQVKCDTKSTSYFCKRRNCPRATSYKTLLNGCACTYPLIDIITTITPEERFKLKYNMGEVCIEDVAKERERREKAKKDIREKQDREAQQA